MNLTFDLAIVQDCVLQIKDTTREYDDQAYLPENINNYPTPNRFKYSDTMTINVIQYKKYTKEYIDILETIITPHLDEDGAIVYLDEAYYSLQQDGHYIIDHLVLPTKNFIDKYLKIQAVDKQQYEIYYYTDGVKFYKYDGDQEIECTIEEILTTTLPEQDVTISKTTQETFSICYLHKCYLEQCKDYFYKVIKDRCATVNFNHNFTTDLIWLSINAIKYNIEFGRLEQAQSILEDVMRCGNLCKISKINQYDCGCSK